MHRLFRQLLRADLELESMEDILLPQTIESEGDDAVDGQEYDLEEDDSESEDWDSGVTESDGKLTFSHYVRVWEIPEREAEEVFARWKEQSPIDANR